MSKTSEQVRFSEFVDAVAERLTPAVVGDKATVVASRKVADGLTNGWYCPLLTLQSPDALTFEVWRDRYLDPEGDLLVSCWVNGDRAAIQRIAARAELDPGWGLATSFDDGDRARGRQSLRVVPSPTLVARPMVDRWNKKWGDYFGRYLSTGASLDRHAAVTAANCLVQLVDLASPQVPASVVSAAESADDDSGLPDLTAMQAIRIRRGQADFRRKLLKHFGGQCIVSGSRIENLLEAAHIVPHGSGGDYSLANGVLLRADLHTLFDLGEMWFEKAESDVVVCFSNAARREDPYRAMHGFPLRGVSSRHATALVRRGRGMAFVRA